MTSIAIALPGSLWPPQAGVEPYDGLRIPALTGILSAANAQVLDVRSWSSWLMQALTGAESDIPFALCAAQASGLTDANTNETWLRADPVHYVAGREDVALGSLHDFSVSEGEARACLASLNTHFAQDGLRWHAVSGKHWLLRVPDKLNVQTVDPWAGVNMPARFVPMRGEHARLLRKWTTEAQMLLYNHPINEARHARGERAINSVWMWAAGSDLPAALDNVALVSSCKQANLMRKSLKMPEIAPQVLGYFPNLMAAFLEGDGERWRSEIEALFAGELAAHLKNAHKVELILGGQCPQVRVPLTTQTGLRGRLNGLFSNSAAIGKTFSDLAALQ